MIQIENLSFSFRKQKQVLSELNMSLQSGRTYGLFGLNGAGKSTLLNLISGLLFPQTGSCLVLNENSRDRLPETLRNIFFVPEQFDLPAISAEAFLTVHTPFYPSFDSELMDRLIGEFSLEPDERPLTEYSLGQRKKFLIAFALSANTRILLMDEPTNGLDIPSKSKFRKVMAMTESSDRCTVISTHQVRDLDSIIDRFTVLHNGTIIFDETVEEIIERLVIESTD